ncbi:MAG: hypothetical protein ACP5JG_18075 [Anaerolineae bacterium]
MPVIIVVVLVILIVIIATWIRNLVTRSRTTKLEEKARFLDFHFTEEGDLTLIHRSGPFLLFALGDSRGIRNLMQGQIDEIDVAVFDFRYSVSLSPRYAENWWQTVVRLSSPSLDLPTFSLLPEEVHDAITDRIDDPMMQERLLGMASLRFDGYPEFNERYRLQGMDHAGIEALFGDDLLHYFEGRDDIAVEGDGTQLIFYRFNEPIPPEEIEEFLRKAIDSFHAFEEAGV